MKLPRLMIWVFLLTNDLNFDQHCEQVATKAMRATYRLFKALTTRDSSVLLCAFKSYIRPLLEYGTVIFNPYKRKTIAKLEKVQNNFTRKLLIGNTNFNYRNLISADDRNKKFGLHSLCKRRRKFDLIMFYKLVHGLCGLDPDVFCTFKPSVTRGDSVKLYLPRTKTKFRSQFFINRAGSDYLALSRLKEIPGNIRSFTRILDSYVKWWLLLTNCMHLYL